MVIFHSYVNLPEATVCGSKQIFFWDEWENQDNKENTTFFIMEVLKR